MNTELKIKLIENLPDELLNPNFAFGFTNWTKTGAWSYRYGYAIKTPGGIGTLYQDVINAIGTYKIMFSLFLPEGQTTFAGELTVLAGGATNSIVYDTAGTYETYIPITSLSNGYLLFSADASFNGAITNISIEKVDGLWESLDLYDDIDIPLNLNIANLQDISKKNSSYSKTITIPGTAKNNIFFNHIYNISSYDTWDFNSTVKTAVELDSMIIFEGGMELMNINLVDGEITYEINIFQDAAEFYNKMGSKFLTDNELIGDNIDFSEYNHILNIANIRNSFSVTPGSGYLYSFIDKTNHFNSTNALTACQFQMDEMSPCLFIKEIWDKIFNKYGYSYSSTFLNSDRFKRLIYPHTDRYLYLSEEETKARNASAAGGSQINQVNVNTSSPQLVTSYQDITILPEISDGSYNNFDAGIYTAKASGYYDIDVEYNYTLTLRGFLGDGTVRIMWEGGTWNLWPGAIYTGIVQIVKTDLSSVETVISSYVDPGANDFLPQEFAVVNEVYVLKDNLSFKESLSGIYLKTGETLKLRAVLRIVAKFPVTNTYIYRDENNDPISPVTFVLQNAIPNSFFSVKAQNIVTENCLVEMNNILHKVKQADFISSISKMFNLYWQPTSSKSFTIEPREDFYALSTSITDWTNKLCVDKDIKIEKISDLPKKYLKYTYKKDKDHFNSVYSENNYERIYGSNWKKQKYNKDEDDVLEFETIFSPTPSGKLRTSGTYYNVPKIFYTKEDGSIDFSKKFEPRILYYSGFITNFSLVFTSQHLKIYGPDAATYYNAVSTGAPYYPYIDHLNGTWESHTFDLNFGQCNWYWQDSGLGWVTNNNLYNTYYLKQITELIDPNSKLVTASLILTPQDIKDFNFYNIYLIDGIYYRINKIIDYVPYKPIKVELFKTPIYNLGTLINDLPLPYRPPVIPPIDPNIFTEKPPTLGVVANTNGFTIPTGTTINADMFDSNTLDPSALTVVVTPTSYKEPLLANNIAINLIDPNILDERENVSIEQINSNYVKTSLVTSYKQLSDFNPYLNGPSFVFEWEVTTAAVYIPTVTGFNYNASIDWGDGTITTITAYDSPGRNHTYTTAGTYIVKITGLFETIRFFSYSRGLAIKKILSFGDVGWKSLFLAFTECSNLTTLPSEKAKFEDVTSFSTAFGFCTGLTSIPSGLFDSCINVTSFDNTFSNCTSLTSIPSGLFDNCTNVTDFSGTFFGCSSLTSIPSGLFDNCVNVTTFGNTFGFCTGLTSIPSGLFDNNVSVTIFDGVFNECTGLTFIPSGLFDNNVSVTTFAGVFYNCASLTGLAPELWLRVPEPLGTGCFVGCVNLSNYASIPVDWK